MKKLILVFILMLIISGCRPSTPQVPTPTSTFIPITPRLFATYTSNPTATFTPIPTNSPAKSPTPTFIPTPSPTAVLAALVMATQQPILFASYPSPDGMWRMDIIIYDCIKVQEDADENAYEQLLLVDPPSEDGQVAAEQLQYCGGLGAYGFDGRYWSPNSRYFYYTDARQGLPDGCGYWVPPLSRYDIAFAKNEYLGSGSLSPDGSKVAAWNTTELSLMIWDVNDGEIARYSPLNPVAQVGPIAWSPDSQKLVYLQADSWCPLSGTSYLMLVDVANHEQTLRVDSENPTFGSVEWNTEQELRLIDVNGIEWQYDLLSRELSRVP